MYSKNRKNERAVPEGYTSIYCRSRYTELSHTIYMNIYTREHTNNNTNLSRKPLLMAAFCGLVVGPGTCSSAGAGAGAAVQVADF